MIKYVKFGIWISIILIVAYHAPPEWHAALLTASAMIGAINTIQDFINKQNDND